MTYDLHWDDKEYGVIKERDMKKMSAAAIFRENELLVYPKKQNMSKYLRKTSNPEHHSLDI